MLLVEPNSSAGGKAIQSCKPRVRPALSSPPLCHMPRPALHPFDAPGLQCVPGIVRVDIVDRSFHNVGQGGDTGVGMQGTVEGRAPSWSKRSRKTNGFRISPKSDGLIKRVMGPFVRPRVRCMIARASRRGVDLDWTSVIEVPLKIA
jgi:hypothetical protein